MQIFDIVEELEKERKKNKELEEDVNKYVCYYRFVKMEKEDLQDRIDKAIEYIEEMKKSDMIFTSICEKELLDILKGE